MLAEVIVPSCLPSWVRFVASGVVLATSAVVRRYSPLAAAAARPGDGRNPMAGGFLFGT